MEELRYCFLELYPTFRVDWMPRIFEHYETCIWGGINEALPECLWIECILIAKHHEQRAGNVGSETEADIATFVDHVDDSANPTCDECFCVGDAV